MRGDGPSVRRKPAGWRDGAADGSPVMLHPGVDKWMGGWVDGWMGSVPVQGELAVD